MDQQNQSATQQSDKKPLSQNAITIGQQAETIETCTMDPCTMKMESKTDHHGKCPDCGKMDKQETAGKND